MKRIYLDYAAATPVDRRVLSAMQPYFTDKFYNPSSLYTPAREVKQAYEQARASVAKLLGAKSGEIIFTAGATESINLAIVGLKNIFAKAKIVISATEHQAVAEAAGLTALVCPVKATGSVDLPKLQKLLNKNVVLVSVMLANNEIGSIQPISQIAGLIKAERSKRQKQGNSLPIYLHSDASQAANYLELKVDRLRADLLTLNGAKIYGPKQSGCLYVRSGLKLQPLVLGGGQERGLRSGTENVAGAIGFAKALEITQSIRPKESNRLASLQTKLLTQLLKIPGSTLNGSSKKRLPNNLHLSFEGIDGEMLVHYLDHAGLYAATGAACSANKDTTSATLLAIGLSRVQANSSLRLSLGRQTTSADVDAAAKIITQTVDKLRRKS